GLRTYQPEPFGGYHLSAFGRQYRNWKINLKRRTASRLAMHADVAATLFDDPVDGRQPETCSLGKLRRKERFENMRLCFFVHTAAVILYGQQNVFPGFQVGRMNTLAFGQIDVACFETYRAARGHGVAGVNGQVNQDLLDLDRVGHDRLEFAVGN